MSFIRFIHYRNVVHGLYSLAKAWLLSDRRPELSRTGIATFVV